MALPYLSGSLWIDGLAVLVLLYLLLGVRSYYRLSHIPGPKLWAWTSLPLAQRHFTGNFWEKFAELNNEYGPLVRIGPNTLLVGDPQVLRRMNAARSPYTRSDWYVAARLLPGIDNVLSTTNEAHHESLRRKMAMGYSGKENITLEADIDDCVRDLIILLERKYLTAPGAAPVPMDLARKVQFFTADVMSKLSFNAKFNDLRDDADNFDYINEVETVYPPIYFTSMFPGTMNFFTRIGLLQKLAPPDTSTIGFGKILGIAKEQVSKRFDSDGKVIGLRQDMLGSFLRHGLTKSEAETETVLNLAAGTDTTATGIRALLLCLMQSPRAFARLAAEIDEAVASGKVESDINKIISDEQARKLPYLQACIREGLRWWPPIAGLLPKKTPPQGDSVNGFFVPGGVDMAYSAKAAQRWSPLFGPDGDSFRPERWIHVSEGGDEASTERITEMERNNDQVFGYGKYQCLGKAVALLEMNKAIFEIVRRFEMSLVNPQKPWVTSCFGIHFQHSMWVNVRRRNGRGDVTQEEKV